MRDALFSPRTPTSVQLSDPSRIAVSGELGERIQRSIEHLKRLNTDELRRELVAAEPGWHWGADYMGRWLGAMATLEHHTGEDHGARSVAHELIGHQHSDGSFGSYAEGHDVQEWFGMGRGLVGLLDYHGVTGDPAALEAARRLGEFYDEHYPEDGDFQVECYAAALDGLVTLASRTGEERYLRTARRVADSSPVVRRRWYSTEFGYRGIRTPYAGAVHCHLLAGRGLLDLYEITGEARYLDAAYALYDLLLNETISVSGAVGEFLMADEETETCSDADWLRFNLQLWRHTREGRYMEMAEHVLFNAIFFDQADTGAFCYRRGVQGRPGASFDACCSNHGARAMVEVVRYVFAGDPDSLTINLLLDATGQIDVGGKAVGVETATWQDADERIFGMRLRLDLRRPASFPLRIRIPAWAADARVALNGAATDATAVDDVVTIEREWRAEDTVELRLPLRLRVAVGHTIGRHVVDDRAAAVFLGRTLFCLTERLNPEHRVDFLRLALPASEPERAVRVAAPDRLQAPGIGPDGEDVTLSLWPLAAVGGSPNGIGRTHPTKAPSFKAWIPLSRPDPSSP